MIYKTIGERVYRRGQCRACFYNRPSFTSEGRKRANLWSKYKLSMEAYGLLIKNGCEVCGTHENLCIDHDHECCADKKTCGKCIRGVLCDRHNRVEGMLRGNADEAISLAAYLLKFEKSKVSKS